MKTMRVDLSGHTFVYPDECACCGGVPDRELTVWARRSRGTRVIHTETKLWDVPYCTARIEHIRAEISRELQNVRLSLAQYRSSLVTVGEIHYTQKVVVGPKAAFKIGGHVTMDGGYFDIRQVPEDFIQAAPPNTGTLADNIKLVGSAILGGMQTLDGIHWSHVVFIGTHIKYRGGELDLDDVTFVGCTFEAPDNNRGVQFANYVALMEPQLQIQSPATHS
jgi:hypothetical protein